MGAADRDPSIASLPIHLVSAGSANSQTVKETIDLPPQNSPHFRRLRAAICSYLDAEMGRIEEAEPPDALKVGALPVEW
jgi:hypothetical protein